MSFFFVKLNKTAKFLNIKLIHSNIYKDDMLELYEARV